MYIVHTFKWMISSVDLARMTHSVLVYMYIHYYYELPDVNSDSQESLYKNCQNEFNTITSVSYTCTFHPFNTRTN